MEEEFVANQKRLKPQEEKNEEDQSKVDDLRGPPMSVENLEELIDENHAIVTSSVGPKCYVGILSFVVRISSSLAVLFLCTIRFFFFFLLCFRVLVFDLICLILCFYGDCWCLELQTLEFLECGIDGILIWIFRKFKRIDFWKNYEILFLGVVWFGL